jgi:hypothetical protein
MDTVSAARDSINLAFSRGMATLPTLASDPGSFSHLCNMLNKMEKGMKPKKANRYLGWIQACIFCKGMATTKELKEINRRYK